MQYLEARLVELAAQFKRCELDNANAPILPGSSDADLAEIEGFLVEMLSLLPVLGVNAFEAAEAAKTDKRIYSYRGSGWEATGYESSNGFVVQAGSIARLETTPSIRATRVRLREQLEADGVLERAEGGLRFTVDDEFSAPSAAATVTAGRSTNERRAWKDGEGVSSGNAKWPRHWSDRGEHPC